MPPNRKEEREFGMTIVYDSRKIPPNSEFFEALQILQVGACILLFRRDLLCVVSTKKLRLALHAMSMESSKLIFFTNVASMPATTKVHHNMN